MNLRNNQITIRELLSIPAARRILERQFPHVVGNPVVMASTDCTVEQAMKRAAPYVPRETLLKTLRALEKI